MKKVEKEALSILMTHAACNVRGVGCGIRSEISAEQREDVRKAVIVLWRYCRTDPCTESALRNMGL